MAIWSKEGTKAVLETSRPLFQVVNVRSHYSGEVVLTNASIKARLPDSGLQALLWAPSSFTVFVK